MKTLEEAITYLNGDNDTFDSRCANRLCKFCTKDQIKRLECEFTSPEAEQAHQPIAWTREAILVQLANDVEFGFEKALDQRGISAGLMASVVQFWNWVLEEGLEDFDSYRYYGLPIFKATAVKYGFPNPIGDNAGNEPMYGDD